MLTSNGNGGRTAEKCSEAKPYHLLPTYFFNIVGVTVGFKLLTAFVCAVRIPCAAELPAPGCVLYAVRHQTEQSASPWLFVHIPPFCYIQQRFLAFVPVTPNKVKEADVELVKSTENSNIHNIFHICRETKTVHSPDCAPVL